MLEGGENVGKGTQLKLLEGYFSEKRIKFISVREPGETEPGKLIRNILLERREFDLHPLAELFLYQADRVETFHKIIIPNLENKINVLEDRGWPASHAYQGVAGGLNNIYRGLVKYLNEVATFGILPDILFIIDGNHSKLLKKIDNPDRMESKKEEFHHEVRKGYLEIADNFPEISKIIPYQEGNPKAMQEEIRRHLEKRLGI